MIVMLITYCYVNIGECRVEEVGQPMHTWEECENRSKVIVKTMVDAIGDDGSAAIGVSCSVNAQPAN
jgi:hypothetical protein